MSHAGPAWGSAKGDARDSNQGSLPLGFRSYVKVDSCQTRALPELHTVSEILTHTCIILAQQPRGIAAAIRLTPTVLTSMLSSMWVTKLMAG